ncbi:MAG TPA: hypothetical protein VJ276_11040, partial [Thermoanaerobaculia bacterium]|nr:hypothetical protein [Thermoanaerobaculia bacterium]
AIAQSEPAATLRADEFDAPAPTAVSEAAKAAAGMPHSMEGTPPQPQPPPSHQHPPHHHEGLDE